jgi:uncharacterized membrane protein YhaH (DUF805 family)
MSWQQFLLSPHGRVSREQYWLMTLLTLPFIIAAAWASGGIQYLAQRPGVFYLLPIVWPSLVVTIKRWHDRNKSGWWVLINLVPVVGDIWSVVENGFLKGTRGENRFGPDPLARDSMQTRGTP